MREKLATVCDIIRAQMNKQYADDFNASEYERKIRKRHKRIAVGLVVVATATLLGMIVLWH